MKLELSSEEAALLDRVLLSSVSDLRMEISRTDNFRFRQELKHDEETLKLLASRLEASKITDVAAF